MTVLVLQAAGWTAAEIALLLTAIGGVLGAMAEHWRTSSIREDLCDLRERVAKLEGKANV